MIRIIAGAAFVDDGPKRRVLTPDDGPVSLSDALETRFVKLGVAKYVDDTEAPAAPKVDKSEKPADVVEDSDDPMDDDDGYGSMTIDELRAECDERGIGYGKRANSAQLIRLLEADDEPPAIDALGAES